ncbi:MAG: hypothetical protein ABEJ82_05530 [Haloplanus sp.]
MTRFDADTAPERRKLFAEAILAHRTRGSRFLTVEVDADDVAGEAEGTSDDAESEEGTPLTPWIQFADQTFNLDCTDAELDRLKDLLSDFPEFRIDQLERPEDAEGTNVRVTARSDANRLAQFADRALRTVYGLDEDYRAWVVQV